LTNYAETLELQEKWCEAEEQYITLRDYTGDSSLDEKIDIIADKCR